MIFHFPDLETLRIALTSGLVPPTISMEPAEVAFDAIGRPSVKPHSIPPKAMQNALKRLGVKAEKAHHATPIAVGSWPEILPVMKEAGTPAPASSEPVLFDIPTARLADFATEMLRLGNDRQSFRHLADASEQRVLLRVIAPPYYTLLRAMDRLEADVIAYVEKAPRVWVEIGCAHPLAGKLKVPEGQILLLRPPRCWTFIEDAPFHDIYEILDFQLPKSAIDYAEGKLEKKLTVPLRLTAGNAADAPEMWVLRENALDIFDAFVGEADERLMARLMFAVAENGDAKPVIVLRTRPSKLAVPVLDLTGAEGYVRYRKLDNLFVPSGTRLQPTLRRDAIRKMLADDPAQIVWLTPLGDGRFVPETLADEAFRPLQDWVDYVVQRERQALQNWVQATRFDFESFICKDDMLEDPKPPGPSKSRKRKADDQPVDANEEAPQAATPKGKTKPAPKPEEEAYAAPVVVATPSEHVAKRDELEKAFLAIEGPIEAPERAVLWPQLARVNAALCDYSEAAICWLHALWERDDLPASWLSVWFHSEVSGAAPEMTVADLDRDLAIAMPTQSDMRQLAARLLHACSRQPVPAALKERLPEIRRYLEKHDASLGIRAVWLVWRNLTKISGDVLGLARVRDQLIERLFKNGLKAQYDVPNFIRFAGQRDSNRLRRVQEHLLQFRGEVHAWLERQDKSKDALHKSLVTTGWYADLIFAYGLAKIGDDRNRNDLMSAALVKLRASQKARDAAGATQRFLGDAFEFRIGQAVKGASLAGSLPAEIRASLDPNDRSLMYNVNKLCKHLFILEPHEKSCPYLAYQQQEDLARLSLILEPAKLMAEIRRLLNGGKAILPQQRLKVLIHAIPLSARVGEAFVRELLLQALPSIALAKRKSEAELFAEIDLHAQLVDAAVSLAANYGWADLVNAILKQYVDDLRSLEKNELAIVASIKKALGQWLRSLRRCGLKDQVEELLSDLTELLLKDRSLEALRKEYSHPAKSRFWVDMLWALLQLAECWIYFGWKSRALPILEEVRGFLFDNEGKSAKNRPIANVYTPLMCAYIRAVSQVDDLDFVIGRFSELFKRMDFIPNTTVAGTHFSAFHLSIVESLVLALVNDDLILGETARRWLDDDEYLVRRRIHADMKKLLAQSGL